MEKKMKVRLLTAFLILSFHNTLLAEVVASSFRFSDKDCSTLTNEISDKIFEQKRSKIDKDKNKYDKETWEYLNKSQSDFSANLTKLCSSKKNNVSIADISNEQSSCSKICNDNIKMVKGAFFKAVEDLNKTIVTAKATCESACNEGQQKLDAIKIGVAYGLKNKSSPDCSGAVAGDGRGFIKPNFNNSESIDTKAQSSLTK
jgi:hypothetical protein